MADKKKIALIAAGGLVVCILCFLGIKGCADNRDQDERLQKLENNDEDLRAVDSVLFNNDDILARNDSVLNRRVNDLYDSVGVLRHDIDSCCDCNKKKPVNNKKRRQTVVAQDSSNSQPVAPVNPAPVANGTPCIEVSNGNGVVIIGNGNTAYVTVGENSAAAQQQFADTSRALRRVTGHCRWENVK